MVGDPIKERLQSMSLKDIKNSKEYKLIQRSLHKSSVKFKDTDTLRSFTKLSKKALIDVIANGGTQYDINIRKNNTSKSTLDDCNFFTLQQLKNHRCFHDARENMGKGRNTKSKICRVMSEFPDDKCLKNMVIEKIEKNKLDLQSILSDYDEKKSTNQFSLTNKDLEVLISKKNMKNIKKTAQYEYLKDFFRTTRLKFEYNGKLYSFGSLPRKKLIEIMTSFGEEYFFVKYDHELCSFFLKKEIVKSDCYRSLTSDDRRTHRRKEDICAIIKLNDKDCLRDMALKKIEHVKGVLYSNFVDHVSDEFVVIFENAVKSRLDILPINVNDALLQFEKTLLYIFEDLFQFDFLIEEILLFINNISDLDMRYFLQTTYDIRSAMLLSFFSLNTTIIVTQYKEFIMNVWDIDSDFSNIDIARGNSYVLNAREMKSLCPYYLPDGGKFYTTKETRDHDFTTRSEHVSSLTESVVDSYVILLNENEKRKYGDMIKRLVLSSVTDPKMLKERLDNIEFELLSFDRLFIPMKRDLYHWFLFVINFDGKCFELYDPMMYKADFIFEYVEVLQKYFDNYFSHDEKWWYKLDVMKRNESDELAHVCDSGMYVCQFMNFYLNRKSDIENVVDISNTTLLFESRFTMFIDLVQNHLNIRDEFYIHDKMHEHKFLFDVIVSRFDHYFGVDGVCYIVIAKILNRLKKLFKTHEKIDNIYIRSAANALFLTGAVAHDVRSRFGDSHAVLDLVKCFFNLVTENVREFHGDFKNQVLVGESFLKGLSLSSNFDSEISSTFFDDTKTLNFRFMTENMISDYISCLASGSKCRCNEYISSILKYMDNDKVWKILKRPLNFKKNGRCKEIDTHRVYFLTHLVFMCNNYGVDKMNSLFIDTYACIVYEVLESWFLQLHDIYQQNGYDGLKKNMEVFFEICTCLLAIGTMDGFFIKDNFYIWFLCIDILKKGNMSMFENEPIMTSTKNNVFYPDITKSTSAFYTDFHSHIIIAMFLSAASKYTYVFINEKMN